MELNDGQVQLISWLYNLSLIALESNKPYADYDEVQLREMIKESFPNHADRILKS